MLKHNENEKCPNCDRNYSSETEVDADTRLKDKVNHRVGQRTMALDDLRHNTKKLKSDFLGQMESRLSAMIDDVMDTLQKTENPERVLMMSDPSMMKDKRKASVAGKLPEKEFRSRPSPLTELLEVPHIKTIHNIFIAALCLVMMHTILSDIIETNTVDLGFERLMWTFGKPLTALGILIPMEVLALFVLYPCFYFWATHRLNYNQETQRLIDYSALGTFAAFMFGFIYFPAKTLLVNPLGPATGAIVTMEQTRLLMKMYAFVRSNTPRALMFGNKNETTSAKMRFTREDENENEEEDCSPVGEGLRRRGPPNGTKGKEGESQGKSGGPRRALVKKDSWISWNDELSPCPSYSRYLYYYFAPTLIYRDQYPRTSSTRWDYVCWNFAQVLGCIFYANMVLGKVSSAYFSKFGLPDHKMTPAMLCNAVFGLMLPGIFGLLLGFFLLLHAWHNAFAEILRFGDRLFYKDWWNRSSFSDYYKTWNVLVHDWLFFIIYKDAWESGLGRKHKALPTTLVFLVSSVVHEYILALSLNFFLPVLFVLFGGFGFALVFVKGIRGPVGNVFMWFGLMAGTGIIVSTYSMEYFARINCPPTSEATSFRDFFIPRSLSCEAFQWS